MTDPINLHDQAATALDNLDDYARMNTGVDAIGPRGVLERYIAEQRSRDPAGQELPAALLEAACGVGAFVAAHRGQYGLSQAPVAQAVGSDGQCASLLMTHLATLALHAIKPHLGTLAESPHGPALRAFVGLLNGDEVTYDNPPEHATNSGDDDSPAQASA